MFDGLCRLGRSFDGGGNIRLHGDVDLTKAPNGAVARAEVLETAAKILYLEPTTKKLADGVWCIGGYSLVNTTVIGVEDGLEVSLK